MLFLQLAYFGVVWWFGLYICNRDIKNVRLLLAGLGLFVYACSFSSAILLPYAQSFFQSMVLLKAQDLSLFLPVILWQGVMTSYTSDNEGKQNGLWAIWKYGVLVLALFSSIWLLCVNNPNVYAISYQAIVSIALILIIALSLWGTLSHNSQVSGTYRILLHVPLILYACMTIMIWVLQDGSWKLWGYVGNGVGLLLFASCVMITEIKNQGESWLPDFFRSLDYSVFFTLLFSGQVALVIMWGANFNFTMVALLLISIAVSIAFQVFVYPIRAMLDNIAFVTFPRLRQASSRLRLEESIQVRVDEEAAPEEMNEDDWYRFTRRALSNIGDLQRLATNPLTQLKWIDTRLRERGATNEVLERAIELKSVLLEIILQLKPRGDEEFGNTDEWRHFNVLYFPYIVGIKPYSIRYSAEHLDTPSRAALEWLRTHVPERTLYNWQNAGARVIAMSMKDKASVHKK
ncbi:hypothetical protein SAMN03159341_101556 [Paenibacillus sp. 1_12]|uniref:hypothetical protein n=1 Tax=Paenibacillus sp. 1_12 TaxID=1566278 RepID=UPI0008DF1DCE|nr:hypothetical protein [Paenibacillus sp. 1_12]SFK78387.1 hypothetical protein SAMN03159341_101556 [Paenibacillus sp. 1_12]